MIMPKDDVTNSEEVIFPILYLIKVSENHIIFLAWKKINMLGKSELPSILINHSTGT